jgi:isomerase DpgB
VVTGQRVNAESPALLELGLRIDGSRPPTAGSVAELAAVCDRAEDAANGNGAAVFVILRLSGVPGPGWSDHLSPALVSKWERGLRRVERLPAVTIAVADDDCGGVALDALLAADYRVMPAGARLVPAVVAGATWPGMALYRLSRRAGGASLARRAVLFGTPIDAAEARAAGIIDEVAGDAAAAFDKAMAVALTVAAPGAELAIGRELLLEAPATTFEEALGVHLAACDRALRSVATGPA